MFVARDAVDEEPDVFEGLAAAGHLGPVRNHGIGRVDDPPVVRRYESSRVMIVAVSPSTGVMWSLPSRRGRSYSPRSAAAAMSVVNADFGDRRRRDR